MPTIGMSVDMSALVNATVAENSQETITVARNLLRSGAPAAELAGRAGLIAAAGDSDGHAIVTLSASAALSRWMMSVPHLPEQDPESHDFFFSSRRRHTRSTRDWSSDVCSSD